MVCGLGVTFAKVHAAAERTVMLWPIGVDVPSEFEQTGRVPLCRIGHYLCEEILETLCLLYTQVSRRFHSGREPDDEGPSRTCRMVEMKTELALERQRNVVCGFAAAFSLLTPRIIAGCWRGG